MLAASWNLTPRRQHILRAVVEEHVGTAMPVPSEALVQRHGLSVSSATVRNEMVVLEELGLIYQPHTSAGRVPSDDGYRYYVANLMGELPLSPEEKLTIQHQFYQIELQLQEWLQTAVAILARGAQNAAIASSAEAGKTALRHIELVSLHDATALVVVISRSATVNQQAVSLPQAATQAELGALALRLTDQLGGFTARDVLARLDNLQPMERIVRKAVAELLERQDAQRGSVMFHDGLANLLSQPEYSRALDRQARQDRISALLQVVEHGEVVRELVPQVVDSGNLQMFIGERQWEAIRDCTLILAPYGNRHGVSGVIGVVGPTRMDYARTLGVVRYVTAILSALAEEVGSW